MTMMQRLLYVSIVSICLGTAGDTFAQTYKPAGDPNDLLEFSGSVESADILLIETKEGFSAFSKSLGKWDQVRLTPSVDGKPLPKRYSCGLRFCCVLVGDELYGFSSAAGRWSRLKIPKEEVERIAPQHRLNLLFVQLGDRTYALSPSTGEWTSSDDTSIQNGDSKSAMPDSRMPDSLTVERTLRTKIDVPESRELTQQRDKHESSAASLADEYRSLVKTPTAERPEGQTLEDLRRKIETELSSAFDLKNQIEQLRVRELRSRLDRLEQQIGFRQSHRTQIIERRTHELIAGEGTEWNSEALIENSNARSDTARDSDRKRDADEAVTDMAENATFIELSAFDGAPATIILPFGRNAPFPLRELFSRDAKELRQYQLKLISKSFDLDNMLLNFESKWAGPCQQMRPVVLKLERQNLPIRSIDIDTEKELARKFHVDSIPCFVLVSNGKEVNRITGLTDEKSLRELMKTLPKTFKEYLIRLNVYPERPSSSAFLKHNRVRFQLTSEDFRTISAGHRLTKVAYLPDAEHQELAISDVSLITSSRLDPNQDPFAEAKQRGTLLASIEIEINPLKHPTSQFTDDLQRSRDSSASLADIKKRDSATPTRNPADLGQSEEGMATAPSSPSYTELVTRLSKAKDDLIFAQQRLNEAPTFEEYKLAKSKLEAAELYKQILRDEYSAIMQDLQLQVDSGKSELDFVDKKFNLLERLQKTGSVSSGELDETRQKLTQAKLKLQRLITRRDLYQKAGDGMTATVKADTTDLSVEPAMKRLGLQLRAVTADEWRLVEFNKYRGGLRIVDVAPDGPCAQSGLQKDDILVGLDKWECSSLDNFAWIMKQIEGRMESKPSPKLWKLFIQRGKDTKIFEVPLVSPSQNPEKERTE